MSTRGSLIILAAAAAFALPARSQAQSCNGLPLAKRGAAAAAYRQTGDVVDLPFTVTEYGARVVVKLPGKSPLFGTNQTLRIEGGTSDIEQQTGNQTIGFTAHNGNAKFGGIAYTVDALPGSYAGEFAICLNAGVNGASWDIEGNTGKGFNVPVSFSFGVPLTTHGVGVAPHAEFGGYLRHVTGDVVEGTAQYRSVRPFGTAGVGALIGPIRLDARIGHEFQTHSRVALQAGFVF